MEASRHKRSHHVSVGLAVAQFALPGVAAVILLGFGAVAVFRDTGRTEAIGDAKEVTRLAGEGIVAPYLTPQLAAGRRRALLAMDRIVRERVLHDPVVRVKVWDSTGRIIYSDVAALEGTRYPLRSDERNALRTGGVDAEVSDLARPENRFERPFGKLLEVYLGVRGTDGRPLLFEAYQRYSAVTESGRRVWRRFAPALIGALLLLEFVQIPLAWSLARRLRRGQEEREALLRRAIDASDRERRRIARDLHDGVVQNLAGVAFNLSAAAGEMAAAESETASTALAQAADETRQSVRALRSLLVDIYPPSLHREGLEAALSDLLAPLAASEIETSLEVDPDLTVSDEVEAILFRAAQEALRNALAHSGAGRVDVKVAQADGQVAVEVADDGRGFDDEVPREGHFGLRMLRDLARDAGGSLAVESRPGEGTRVRMEVPRA